MPEPDTTAPEQSFDPAEWVEFASLAHRMVDTMLDHLKSLGEGPAWQESPKEIRNRLNDEPLPREGVGESAAFEQFVSDVLPYGNGNADPRFFGWVQGNGTPLGMMADMLASGMNPHLAGFNQNPALVEAKVVDWMRELMGFPEGSSGLLLGGGSMANLTGLVVARNVQAGFDVRADGLQGNEHPPMRIYCSSETHSWAKKTVEVLGMGARSLRVVPTNADFTMDLAALAAMIADDRQAGYRPIVVIASAGTVNTGATDDLNGLADLCAAEDLWLHVDGAFGALCKLSPALAPIVSGLERADSVAFDLHKWMYLPFEIACVLVRDGEAHRQAFSQNVSYLSTLERGVSLGGQPFAGLGIELTRGFKALKAWMSLKAYGVNKFAALIEQNVAQAQYLAGLVRAESSLELTAPAPLNVVCFRYVHPNQSQAELNELNQELLMSLQERGLAVPSSTVINGNFCLRACFVNHRTQLRHVDDLMEDLSKLGQFLLSEP